MGKKKKQSDQSSEQRSAPILHSPNGLPCFPLTGKPLTLEMVKEAEAEQDMDLEEARKAGLRLLKLGGTAPDIKDIPRRRPPVF